VPTFLRPPKRASRRREHFSAQARSRYFLSNYKYLGAIERGKRNLSTDNLAKIAKVLGVQPHELFMLEHEIEDIQVLRKRIDDLLKDASKKEFKTIYRVIEAILK
jgi:transcriptional regulator with XRE-family HTH domain